MNVERTFPRERASRWAHASLLDPLALSFSRHIAARIDWTKTRFRVLAEQSLPDDELLDLEHGAKVSGEPHPDEWLDECIRAVVVRQGGFVIAEDWTVRPQHSFLTDRGMPAIFHNEEVYYVVPLENLARESNWRRILSNTVPLFHAFIIDGKCPATGDSITDAIMETWSTQSRMAIFGIYDGESYLVASFR